MKSPSQEEKRLADDSHLKGTLPQHSAVLFANADDQILDLLKILSRKAAAAVVRNTPYDVKVATALLIKSLNGIRLEGTMKSSLADLVASLSLSAEAASLLGLGSEQGPDVLHRTILAIIQQNEGLGEELLESIFLRNYSDAEKDTRRRLSQVFRDPHQNDLQKSLITTLHSDISQNPSHAFAMGRVLEQLELINPMTLSNCVLLDILKSLDPEDLVKFYLLLLEMGQQDAGTLPDAKQLIAEIEQRLETRASLETTCTQLVFSTLNGNPSLVTELLNLSNSTRSQSGMTDWLPSILTQSNVKIHQALNELDEEIAEAASEEMQSQIAPGFAAIGAPEDVPGDALNKAPVIPKEEYQTKEPEDSDDDTRDDLSKHSPEQPQKAHIETLLLTTPLLPQAGTHVDLRALVSELRGTLDFLTFISGEIEREHVEIQEKQEAGAEEERLHKIIVTKTEDAVRTVIQLMPHAINSPIIESLLQRNFRDKMFPVIETPERIRYRLGLATNSPEAHESTLTDMSQ